MNKKTYKRLLIIWFTVGCLLGFSSRAGAFTVSHGREEIRIREHSIRVESDSVRFDITFDLSQVKVTSSSAFILVPVLRTHKKTLDMPAVIVAGHNRSAFDMREDYLTPSGAKRSVYAYIRYNRNPKERPDSVRYRVSIPYASWMMHAELALRQLAKDCCTETQLALDALNEDINLNANGFSSDIQRLFPLSGYEAYRSMLCFLPPEITETRLPRRSATLYIDYEVGLSKVDPGYGHNRRELQKADSLLRPLLDRNQITIRALYITGYASPDGKYADNEELAKKRTLRFRDYMQEHYRLPAGTDMYTLWIAEDWDGTAAALEASGKPYKNEALAVIRRYGVFEGREKQLMDLKGGEVYKRMLDDIFPRLRRIEMTVEYEIRKGEGNEAEIVDLLYTDPTALSLSEIFSVARFYRPGSEQYREVYEIAAIYHPDNVVANVNAAAAVLLMGDIHTGRYYLEKVKNDPRAYINLGVLCMMEGKPAAAGSYFRKALAVNPRLARYNLEKLKRWH